MDKNKPMQEEWEAYRNAVYPGGISGVRVFRQIRCVIRDLQDQVRKLQPPPPTFVIEGSRHAGVQHGVNCKKAAHRTTGGELHAPDDDRPYDVDGCSYCGRCHYAL